MVIVTPDAPRRLTFDWSTSLCSSRSAPTDSHLHRPTHHIPSSHALPRWTLPFPTYPDAVHSIGQRAFARPDPTLPIPTRISPNPSHPAAPRETLAPHFRLVDGCPLRSDPLPTWQVPSHSAPSSDALSSPPRHVVSGRHTLIGHRVFARSRPPSSSHNNPHPLSLNQPLIALPGERPPYPMQAPHFDRSTSVCSFPTCPPVFFLLVRYFLFRLHNFNVSSHVVSRCQTLTGL